MVLKTLLNADSPADDPAYWVDEEGLCGRTSCREDPVEGDMNGFRQLIPFLESHKPLDIVIVMLGTNDLKIRHNPCAYDIAQGVKRVVNAVKDSRTGPHYSSPKVVMVCPPPVADSPVFKQMFGECVELSKKLPEFYRYYAKEAGAVFLDAGKIIKSSAVDGIHLDPDEHLKLAEAMAEIVRTM
jgi:lysophospholipase L1-like esterase